MGIEKMIIIFSVLILLILGLMLIYGKSKLLNKKYRVENNMFHIKGNKDEFIIKKNDKVEFLIKDGEIVAIKNAKVDENFVYYKED